MEPVGAAHPALQVPGIGQLDHDTGVAQFLAELQRNALAGLAERHQHNRGRRRERLVDEQCESLDAGRPADPRHRRTAHHLDQPVIAAAGKHRPLCAEIGGDELENRVGVIVETAD